MKINTLVTKLIVASCILFQIEICTMTPKQKLVSGAVFVTFLSNFLIYKSGARTIKNKIDSYSTSIEKNKNILKDLKKFERQLNSDDNTVSKEDFIANMKTFFINHEHSVKVDYEIIDEKEDLFNQYWALSNKISQFTKKRKEKLEKKRNYCQSCTTLDCLAGIEGENVGLLFLSNYILLDITFCLICAEENEFK